MNEKKNHLCGRQNQDERLAAVDWLKVISALLIVVGHYYHMFPGGNEVPIFLKVKAFDIIAKNGGLAIIIFFALSGYLLTRSYYHKGNGNFKEYIILKVKRIWPLHFITMMFCFILQQIRLASGLDFYVYQANGITDLIVGSFFGGHFVTPELSLNGPAWTMSVTFFCYILFWVIMEYRSKINHVLAFAALTIFNTYDLHMVLTGNGSGFPYIVDSVQYSAAFWGGCLVYEICSIILKDINLRHIFDRVSIVLATCSIMLFVASPKLNIWGNDDPTIFCIYILAPILLYWVTKRKLNFLLNKIPFGIGKMYFPLYLVHFPLMLLIETMNQWKIIHIDYSQTSVFISYMIIVVMCAGLISIVLNKGRGN